jgi:hypothetical protein
MWFGPAGFAVVRGVEGEDDARRGGVTGEITADSPGVGEFCSWLAGEVDPEGSADLALVEGDADKALLGPEP